MVWAGNTAVSYLHILGVTAPLTVAITVLVPLYRRGELKGYAAALIVPIVVLIGAAFLSNLLSVGAAVPLSKLCLRKI